MDKPAHTAPGRKLYLVCSHFHPHIGGIERYVHELAKSLAARGCDVTVLTSNTNNAPDDEVIDSFRVLRLPVWKFLGGRYPVPVPGPSFFRLYRTVMRDRGGLFIINTRFFLTSHLGAWIAWRKSSPAVLIEHGTGHFTMNHRVVDRIAHGYEHFVTALLKPGIRRSYGVSSACIRWLGHFGIQGSGVVYNAVDSSYRVRDHRDLRKQFAIPAQGIVISFLGRLLKDKGIMELLDAFDRDDLAERELYLFVAGGGPLAESVAARLAGRRNAFYLGRITSDAAMDLLDQTDIYVAPTRYPEGLPTVILEAGSRGCAVVATAKGGIPEVIPDERFGRIIPENNVDAIVRSLLELSGNKDLREQVGRALQERIRDTFDWTVTADRVISIDKELADAG